MTALKVVAPLLAVFLQHYYTVSNTNRGMRKTVVFPKHTVLVWVMGTGKSVDSNMFFWSASLPLPSPISNLVILFERDSRKVKSLQIRDGRLVRGLESIIHSSIHTSVHSQGAPRVYQERGSQKGNK